MNPKKSNENDPEYLNMYIKSLEKRLKRIESEKLSLETENLRLKTEHGNSEQEYASKLENLKFEEMVREQREQELFFNMLGDTKIIERLKNAATVSNRISLEMLRNILQISTENKPFFDEKIFEWAFEFGFRIDGDLLIFEKDAMLEFIEKLEKEFDEWQMKEKVMISKQKEFWDKEAEEAFQFEKWMEKNKTK